MALPDRERSRAVLVGTGRYRTLSELPAVLNNLEGLRDALCDPAVGGFARRHCTALPDPPGPPVEVLRRVHAIAREATDTLLVYLAGHGLPGAGGRLRVALPGTRDRGDVFWEHGTLAFDDLATAIGDSTARNKVVIVDTCFSGLAIPGLHAMAAERLAEDIHGAFTLTSVGRGEYAWARPGERYTVFTGHLIDLLTDGAEGAGALLTLRELAVHLRARAAGAVEMSKPQSSVIGTVGELALVRNRRHRRAVPPSPAATGGDPIADFVGHLAAGDGSRGGYRPRAVNRGLRSVVDLVADPDRWAGTRPPYFPRVIAPYRRGYHRPAVDAFVLGHRPAPRNDEDRLRHLLLDEGCTVYDRHTPSRAGTDVLGGTRWVTVTAREVRLHARGGPVVVAFEDLGRVWTRTRTDRVVTFSDLGGSAEDVDVTTMHLGDRVIPLGGHELAVAALLWRMRRVAA
ncbi:caspase, EACC1-associated type [Dactylosporangium sp. CS-047395]|uniref:caspase family protein n=1 Tax=Dactylosporangium sp. CS-047395 TaxID=3239936 RepID=UPI003D915C3F